MDPGGDFNFQRLSNYKFVSLQKPEVKERLMKWSMIDGFSMQAYSFDKPFKKYNEREFLTDFLACPNVVSTLLKQTHDRKMIPMHSPAETITYTEVKSTLTTLEVFDKLKVGNKIAYEDGRLKKCLPEYVRIDDEEEGEGYEIEIFDNLRKLLLSNEEQSEDYYKIEDVLSTSEKKEFLFKLFAHLVIGGSLCQYEDYMEPYLEATKLLYKDLIGVAAVKKENSDCVRRDGSGDGDGAPPELRIISHVYKIHSVKGRGGSNVDLMFHRKYHNNFFYIIVNPLKQTLFTLYHHV